MDKSQELNDWKDTLYANERLRKYIREYCKELMTFIGTAEGMDEYQIKSILLKDAILQIFHSEFHRISEDNMLEKSGDSTTLDLPQEIKEILDIKEEEEDDFTFMDSIVEHIQEDFPMPQQDLYRIVSVMYFGGNEDKLKNAKKIGVVDTANRVRFFIHSLND